MAEAGDRGAELAAVDMEDRMGDGGQTIHHEMDLVVEEEECRIEVTHQLHNGTRLEVEAEDTAEGTKANQKRRRHQGETMSP